MTLHACFDVSPAGWITTATCSWQQLVRFGPPTFPAYARLRFLPDPDYPEQSESEVDVGTDVPSEAAWLRTALEVLARHTRTPGDCYFCLWDGWGDLETGDGVPIPKVVVPNRAYFLFRGRLSEFGDWGAAEVWPNQPELHLTGPAFIWPADRAWCVADDVDPHYAGIGGHAAAISRLLADPRLDVVAADPSEDQPSYR